MNNASQKLSAKEKMAYAIGSLPNSIYSGFLGQIQVFYYAWMGLHPFYIILAQILYAVWNVINDPIFGLAMDRTRTERGRYMPWIRVFSPIIVAGFILIFMVPQEWRFAISGEETQLLLFLWYLITLSFYDLCYTIVFLAHAALMPQISSDFDDRTQMSVIMMVFSVLGSALSFVLPILFLTNPTNDKIMGLRIATVIFGLLTIIPYIFLWTYVKERIELIPETQESLLENIKYVFKNPACRVYIIYDGITLAINQIVITSLTFFLVWTFGLDNPYGSQAIDLTSILILLIAPALGAIFGAWLQTWFPKKKDLKTLLLLDYIFMSVGFLLAFIGALPSPIQSDIAYETPPNLWLVSIGLGVMLLGFLGNMIYLNPLNADVVDYDEILTGNRRESVYSGVNCVFSKPMYSVVLAVFPVILAIYGLLPASPEDLTSNALVVAQGFQSAITGVAVASFLFPAILSIIGFFAFLKYPLNREKLAENRKILEEKHAKQRYEFNKLN